MSLRVKKRERGRYYVVSRSGDVVAGPYTRGDDAQRAIDAFLSRGFDPETENTKVRPCITCRTPFESEGAHNRMCTFCRARAGSIDAQMVV